MAVSQAHQDAVDWTLSYLSGNMEKPLDQNVADTLSPFWEASGAASQIAFLEGLRDKPFSTLIVTLDAIQNSTALADAVNPLQNGQYEKPLDGNVADALVSAVRVIYGDIFADNFGSEISFREGLRDKPFSTLLVLFALPRLPQ